MMNSETYRGGRVVVLARYTWRGSLDKVHSSAEEGYSGTGEDELKEGGRGRDLVHIWGPHAQNVVRLVHLRGWDQ